MQKRSIFLNVVLFHTTAKQWRELNPDLAKNSNVRDYASINELTVLPNLELHNVELIKEGKSKEERFETLSDICNYHLNILNNAEKIKLLSKVKVVIKMVNEKKSFQKTNINWYPGHMAKTKRLIKENLETIDLVYEVVDARMPYSSKIRDLDEIIKNKPRIMIMTKYDLCDQKETKKWIEYYEKQGYSVIPMDIEHQFQKKQILNMTNFLMSEKREKQKAKGMLTKRAKALVIGIPNVGKSTLINRFVSKKVVGTGNRPGITKELNWIRISEDVELLDSPGILWPKIDIGNIAYNLASLTAIKEEILPLFDVTEYILRTLEKYYPKILQERYGIDKVEEDVVLTLEIIGKKRGCLIKGGEIDYDKVITLIMNDVKNGIIRGITFDRVEEINESK